MGDYIPDITQRFPEGYNGVDLTDRFFGDRGYDNYEDYEMDNEDFENELTPTNSELRDLNEKIYNLEQKIDKLTHNRDDLIKNGMPVTSKEAINSLIELGKFKMEKIKCEQKRNGIEKQIEEKELIPIIEEIQEIKKTFNKHDINITYDKDFSEIEFHINIPNNIMDYNIDITVDVTGEDKLKNLLAQKLIDRPYNDAGIKYDFDCLCSDKEEISKFGSLADNEIEDTKNKAFNYLLAMNDFINDVYTDITKKPVSLEPDITMSLEKNGLYVEHVSKNYENNEKFNVSLIRRNLLSDYGVDNIYLIGLENVKDIASRLENEYVINDADKMAKEYIKKHDDTTLTVKEILNEADKIVQNVYKASKEIENIENSKDSNQYSR